MARSCAKWRRPRSAIRQASRCPETRSKLGVARARRRPHAQEGRCLHRDTCKKEDAYTNMRLLAFEAGSALPEDPDAGASAGATRSGAAIAVSPAAAVPSAKAASTTAALPRTTCASERAKMLPLTFALHCGPTAARTNGFDNRKARSWTRVVIGAPMPSTIWHNSCCKQATSMDYHTLCLGLMAKQLPLRYN